jgi:2-iminobutanoate/2-iminopropanoate deaminase
MPRSPKARADQAPLSAAASAGETVKHFTLPPPWPGAVVPLSQSVLVGNTLYISGVPDIDPATGKPATTLEEGARLALDGVKRAVEVAGLTMDDLVWVQIFCTDLSFYDGFNQIYRTYFQSDPLPARAFLGAGHIPHGGRIEIMGIAVKRSTG